MFGINRRDLLNTYSNRRQPFLSILSSSSSTSLETAEPDSSSSPSPSSKSSHFDAMSGAAVDDESFPGAGFSFGAWLGRGGGADLTDAAAAVWWALRLPEAAGGAGNNVSAVADAAPSLRCVFLLCLPGKWISIFSSSSPSGLLSWASAAPCSSLLSISWWSISAFHADGVWLSRAGGI